MELLQQDNYGKILEQLYEIPYNTLFARAVLELKANGNVWVDNQDNPNTVFIAHSYGMSLLFGNTDNETFNTSLVDYMSNTNRNRSKYEWLQVYPEEWNDKLREITKAKIINYTALAVEYSPKELEILIENYRKNHVIQWRRVNFKYNYNNKTVTISPKYNIKLIDADTWEKIEGSVIPNYFWKSKEDFMADGIGYALMSGNVIVSIAFSSCKFENVLEIGVETSENYRGMGFAKLVCEKLLAYCQENNYIPIWACKKENIGSYRLAKSLGFEESLILPYYELVMPPTNT
ncbi:GNAT family N-acetyltransferase [Pelosinus baikalensis]|uniref:GNAT family N-acetyltransferase n=1 Tax=Pelosinus baikalensis TaxID=2892015 RepID=A0ABS8HTJ5_9FIRM|nr:GNAT family N-acetyltransferase [Pelosinus baikalensis]MCC5465437.1 GNAT family N-acetyltransferase [Pelosinus baikalensis]